MTDVPELSLGVHRGGFAEGEACVVLSKVLEAAHRVAFLDQIGALRAFLHDGTWIEIVVFRGDLEDYDLDRKSTRLNSSH